MRKITQNITAGGKVVYPGCKTFVFLTCAEPVSFNFITVFNRIERTIEDFSDTFSVTAKNYFLRVEVTSETTQEVTAILLDDGNIEYKPLRDEVSVVSGQCNITQGKGKVVNFGEYPVQVGANYPLMTTNVLDKVKYERSGGVEGSDPWIWHNTENMGGSDLKLWSPCFYTYYSSPNYWKNHSFIERISIKPTIDTFLEVWGRPEATTQNHLYQFNLFKNSKMMDNISNKYTGYSTFGYRSETQANWVGDSDNQLFLRYPCPANILTSFTPLYPFEFLQGPVINISLFQFTCQYLTTITTSDPCEYEMYIEGTDFQYSNTSGIDRWDSHVKTVTYP